MDSPLVRESGKVSIFNLAYGSSPGKEERENGYWRGIFAIPDIAVFKSIFMVLFRLIFPTTNLMLIGLETCPRAFE